MRTVLVTGSGGLVGSEAVRHFASEDWQVLGIDNDMRARFFGDEASTRPISRQLKEEFGDRFKWEVGDIRDEGRMMNLFERYRPELVIHAAAQPAHDWAATEPFTDFKVNALGTVVLLEAHRRYCQDSTFVYCSTSKVYGDNPNRLPLVDQGTRLDLPIGHRYWDGIDTSMSIDNCLHSLFGASKASADLVVQEYGRYFKIPTVCFRPGCISGPAHRGAQLHGFLSYLMRCAMTGERYTVIGYKGKQVRCNIHAHDLVRAFAIFHEKPRPGAVFNIGGGRIGACSVIEALHFAEAIVGERLHVHMEPKSRIGDHQWWISSNKAFEEEYHWRPTFTVQRTLQEIFEANRDVWTRESVAV